SYTVCCVFFFLFFFSSRRRHTRSKRDWSSDVCSSDLEEDDDLPFWASRAARSERQIVVLLIQGLRERVERFRLAPALRRHLGGGLGPRELAGPFAASPRRQEDHFPRDDLGGVPGLLLPIFPGPILDAPLDVDPVPFLHVLLRQIRQLGAFAFVIPADHPMPLGLFLLLATLPRPLPTGRQGHRGHAGAIVGAPHLGIGTQVPD